MRKPSCLISCTQPGPDGIRSAGDGGALDQFITAAVTVGIATFTTVAVPRADKLIEPSNFDLDCGDEIVAMLGREIRIFQVDVYDFEPTVFGDAQEAALSCAGVALSRFTF
jgi:hypothetical protein